MNAKALAAEFLGTFVVVASLCGAIVFAVPSGGLLVQAVAVGLSAMAMGCAVGPVSGGHFNPAVTLGLVAAGRFDSANAIAYVLAQVAGAVLAAFVVHFIAGGALASGPTTAVKWNDFAAVSNTYGGPRGFSMAAAFTAEAVATAILVLVFVGATSRDAHGGLAPIAIGTVLVVLHLVAIPITNASLNPARSTAPVLLAGGQPLSQLWLFWTAPIMGGIVGGAIGRWLQEE